MDSNPAKRRKTDHAHADDAYSAQPFDAAAASAGLFRPSPFLLETAELLQQSRVDYGKLLPDGEELLRKVKAAVESVETHGPILITKASAAFEKKHGIRIPYPEPRPADDTLLKIAMGPPAHCNVVGSYVLKTMVRSQRVFAVDMIVEMPADIFQEKDYLNLRYFYKRAYYLAHMARAVSQVLDGAEASFAYLGDNPLVPILVVTPKAAAATTETTETTETTAPGPRPSATEACTIRIMPCCPQDVFPRAKLLAGKNCLRPDSATGGGASSSSTAGETRALPATPFYNATLKAESAYVPYLKLLHQAHKSCSAFADACLLGRVWLQQRGLGSELGRGGFGAFEWAALVALLLQTSGRKKGKGSSWSSTTKKTKTASMLSPSLSSTQIFKAVVQFLASTDFRSKPCVLGGPLADGVSGADALREGGTPVLFDAGSGRQLNLAYKMSASSAGLLRQHAQWTHELLQDDGAPDQFTPTFIARADIAREAFDMVARIRCPAATAVAAMTTSRHGAVWDFGDSVFHVMKRALGDRARLIHVQLPGSASWSVRARAPGTTTTTTTTTTIVLGVVFDPVNMARHIDHGPAAEDKKEARRFREFWGERAELRRFKDGRILETLVWTAGQSASALCEEITRHILRERLGLTADDAIEVVAGGGGGPGRSGVDDMAALVPLAPAADSAAFARAREAFATLERDIRALEDLPLHVRQLAPVDAALRSATMRAPPVPSAKAVLRPMEVVLSFEASGKWPDSLAAIQRAKLAFLLRIGESLETAQAAKGARGRHGGPADGDGDGDGAVIETYVGLEEGSGDGDGDDGNDGSDGHDGRRRAAHLASNAAYLDIVYRDVAAFRLRIHSDLEEAILARQTADKTLDARARSTSAHLLAAQRRLCAVRPLHTQALATFAARFPALAPTVRLAKRWFAAHKLLPMHVSDELVELVVLHVFLRPAPWQPPASAGPGFLRTLQFLARWDWRAEPLVVDTSSLTAGAADAVAGEADAAADGAASSAAGDPRTRLAAWRKIDPAMNHTVLFVAATHDMSGTAFTTAYASVDGGVAARPQPSKVAAARMTSLARAACRLVRETDVVPGAVGAGAGAGAVDLEPRLLFQPSLRDFDVLIHLDARVVKRLVKGDVSDDAADSTRAHRHHGHGRSVYKNLDARTGRELHALPAHPVQLLLDQLERVYGSMGPIVFFGGAPDHGAAADDNVIAALWNPQMHSRNFRINLPCSFRPAGAAVTGPDKSGAGKKRKDKTAGRADAAEPPQTLVEVNRAGILAEIARIGGSLIAHIEVRDKAAL